MVLEIPFTDKVGPVKCGLGGDGTRPQKHQDVSMF